VLYAFLRAVVSFALRLFYQVKVTGSPARTGGPVMFVGNHPNGLIDPALIFVITPRHVTFMAKAPLFRIPVYRKQDNPALTQRNEGTLDAAAGALIDGRAITIFPEGRSHSEPQLAELKTGAARIAFKAARGGAPVTIIPVGLTYAEKHLFRSEVLIDVGEPIEVKEFLPAAPEGEPKAARELTRAIASGLRRVTLNLESWEDLPLIQTAEALYAFRLGEKAQDPERLRRFARGVHLFRAEQPERFERVRGELLAFQRRLALVRADPDDLTLVYRPGQVYGFAFRNLARLLVGLPLAALGFALFWLPYQVPHGLARLTRPSLDIEATVKFAAALVVAPLWLLLIFLAVGWRLGFLAGFLVAALAVPLALLTRSFVEHWDSVLNDVRVFFTLGSRTRLKALLLAEGDKLAAEVERLASELGPRVDPAARLS